MGHELGVLKKPLVSWGYTLFYRGKLLLTARDQHYWGKFAVVNFHGYIEMIIQFTVKKTELVSRVFELLQDKITYFDSYRK